MSSMDIDSPDEKETAAMPSLENDTPMGELSKEKTAKTGLINDQVTELEADKSDLPSEVDKACIECQEKGVKCTHIQNDTMTSSRRVSVPDSEDDSSELSEVSSPMLSKASVSAMNTRRVAEPENEGEDAMDVDSKEPLIKEDSPLMNGKNEDEGTGNSPERRSRSRSTASSSSVKIIVDKEDAALVNPEPEAESDSGKVNEPTSVHSELPDAPLPTPATGEGSTICALSPVATIEAEPKPAEPEPEPVVELTAEEKESLATLSSLLSAATSAVARTAVTEHIKKCLLGSSQDEAVFLGAIFSETSDHVVSKFIESHESRIIEVANQRCKPFLDRALEIRVQDIDGKKLAGYLARANRLGFEEQDDIDGEAALPLDRNGNAISTDASDNDGDHRMHPMQPTMDGMGGHWPQPPQGYMYSPAYPMPNFAQMQHAHQMGMKVCHKCGAAFKQNAGLRYHLEKDVCKKAGVPQGPVMARCESCGKEFRSPGGYHYHMTNKVCKVLGRSSASPAPETEAQDDQAAPRSSAGQQPQAKEDEAAAAAEPGLSHTPAHNAQPHMFQMSQQQPYQGPYQNSPLPQPQSQQPLPAPAHVVPSMNGTPQPTAASGEQIINTNGLLTPAQAQKLNEDLRAEDRKYAEQLNNIDPSLQGTALELEIKRLKAGMSTRKSNLRRKHGIFVRKTDKTAANAVRNEDGSIDLAPAGGVSSPAPQSISRGPESPPAGVPDPKRRRVSEYSSSMAPSPYSQGGPTGYPPNYNMHPGSYDPRQQQMIPGPYQQYSMSPYTQASPYQQQPMHPPYGHNQPTYAMNTIIPAPGARPPIQSPNSPAMQGPQGAGYYQPPSGFVSVNQPPPPTPPPGYMLVTSHPPQHYSAANNQVHSHPSRPIPASASSSPRAASAGAIENGKSRPKVPTDNAEKVWKAKQKDWVVQTGPQHAFKRMEKDESLRGGRSGSREDHHDKHQAGMKKKKEKAKSEFIIPISDDEATDEDASARRPSKAASEKDNNKGREKERRPSSTSSELSELDDSALLGAGDGGEPYIARRASEDDRASSKEKSAPKQAKKPAEKKRQSAIRAAPVISIPSTVDNSNDEDLEPGHEILQVASEDEMAVDTPPPPRRRQAAGAASSSAPLPTSSSAGTPGSATAPGQPKKRLGRPVGWKKGMGGYRELLDAGVVHHNEEGTPASRRRAEKRAAERLRRQTEGGDGASDSATGPKPAGGRKSVG